MMNWYNMYDQLPLTYSSEPGQYCDTLTAVEGDCYFLEPAAVLYQMWYQPSNSDYTNISRISKGD